MTAGIVEQVERRGPIFQHWRRRIAASVGGTLVDDLRKAG